MNYVVAYAAGGAALGVPPQTCLVQMQMYPSHLMVVDADVLMTGMVRVRIPVMLSCYGK